MQPTETRSCRAFIPFHFRSYFTRFIQYVSSSLSEANLIVVCPVFETIDIRALFTRESKIKNPLVLIPEAISMICSCWNLVHWTMGLFIYPMFRLRTLGVVSVQDVPYSLSLSQPTRNPNTQHRSISSTGPRSHQLPRIKQVGCSFLTLFKSSVRTRSKMIKLRYRAETLYSLPDGIEEQLQEG
jgi:hypothetical protein